MKSVKSSAININTLPYIYKKIQNDISKCDFNNVIRFHPFRGNIYFEQIYEIDLNGWSGLEKFYNDLEKIKKLKQHDDIAIINRVVLNPSLCLRILSNEEAKQYWQKDFYYRKSVGTPFTIKVIICDQVKGGAGFYDQKQMVLYIKEDQLKQMKYILLHQFIHVLDHITGMVLKRNCDKLIENADFTIGKNDKLIKYPNKKNKSVDLFNINNKNKQQYSSSFAQIIKIIENDFIEDIGYYSKDFNVNVDLSNIMFCYITGYNLLKNTLLDQNALLSKLKQMQQYNIDSIYFENTPLYYDLFDYIVNNNETTIINDLQDVKNSNKYDYIGIIKDMYQQIQYDSYLGQLNGLQKQILSSI